MQISTGRYVPESEFEKLQTAPGFDPSDWVQVTALEEQIERLSAKVQKANGVDEARRRRRQQQRVSRKKNR